MWPLYVRFIDVSSRGLCVGICIGWWGLPRPVGRTRATCAVGRTRATCYVGRTRAVGYVLMCIYVYQK